MRELLVRPEFIHTSVIVFLFLIAVSLLVTWSREQIKVRDGQVMSTTRVNRLDFEVEDVAATEARREEAMNASPRIYRTNDAYLERLEASLLGLPAAVAGMTTVDEVTPELVEQFALTPEAVAALQSMSVDGEPTIAWKGEVLRLTHDLLRRTPLMSSQEFQVFTTTPPANRAILDAGDRLLQPYQAAAIPLPAEPGQAVDPRLAETVSRSGFPEKIVPTIEARLVVAGQPTVLLDIDLSEQQRATAAERVEPIIGTHRRGDVIWRRGDVLTAKQYQNAMLETSQFAAAAPILTRWLPRLGGIGLLAMLAVFIGAYTTVSTPRIARNWLRLVALCALMAGMLAVSVLITIEAPGFLFAAAIAPTLLVVTVACLAYGQRMAMFLAFMQCALVAMALEQPMGWFILIVAGCGTNIAQLREVRQRQTLIRASAVTAIVLGIGGFLLGMVEYPDFAIAWGQALANALLASFAALFVGFFVLGILPSIERIFDITTGMTLADLRDPRQPLLRQLQQLAPGTFNHSRQVADIAEAATEAIGGDALLAYVGGLYHDIGKMNKPEYFVENQSGYNRHRELKPSMSLLIIIGHVKDGIELAREYDLPRDIMHFIESHHGTTLVEYFYHAANREAIEAGEDPISEMNFRYPGPRPRSKEVAVLMIADAVESAARAMPDPNPGRIEALVRDISRKRLLDHQFDECGLTFSDLAKIEDAIVAKLNAIYHARVSYPTTDAEPEPDAEVRQAEIDAEASA
ncbi:MAG: HDIG domain-containing protein [Phycisphaerales bacterium]|jgi:hypothetical protein|nr:HDIG domain-containing protein [Phycisphaerales bacterium]